VIVCALEGIAMRKLICLMAVMLGAFASYPARAQDTLAAQWAELWNTKKLDAVMQLYAPEPVFLPTIGPRWSGANIIRTNFSGLLAHYNPHLHLHSIRRQASGDLAYESGVYDEIITPVAGGKPIPTKGSYIFIFQRQSGGAWKILEQTWTSDAPLPKL
jgi:ketosteroid isomerase-like protein